MTPIWWRRRSKSAVATTGSPRTSPHSANPRFDVEDDSAALIAGVGDSYDNALAETINGLYKAEIIHRRGPWVIGSRRVRDAGMGGLVQQPTALGAHRQHPAGRSRGTLLRHAGTTCHGGVTQTKWPPTNPGRFIGSMSSFPRMRSSSRSMRRAKSKPLTALSRPADEVPFSNKAAPYCADGYQAETLRPAREELRCALYFASAVNTRQVGSLTRHGG